MPESSAALIEQGGAAPSRADPPVADVRPLYEEHADFVARQLRRLGVPASELEDAVQEVFIVASRRVAEVDPERARSFLFGTAVRVASHARRSQRRRRHALDSDIVARAPDQGPMTDELVERRRARELLDDVLDTMSDELRGVFVLFELEGLTAAEIAALLQVPPGTVASRIRRAREHFQVEVARLREREALPWREP